MFAIPRRGFGFLLTYLENIHPSDIRPLLKKAITSAGRTVSAQFHRIEVFLERTFESGLDGPRGNSHDLFEEDWYSV